MFIYTMVTPLIGLIAGLLLALLTKKDSSVTYGTLDKIGRITNIILIPAYLCSAPFTMFLGMVSEPNQSGFMGVIGAIVGVIIASSVVFSGVGLGASVALRKKGKSVASFIIQFAGILGIILTVVLYSICVGSLIAPLN